MGPLRPPNQDDRSSENKLTFATGKPHATRMSTGLKTCDRLITTWLGTLVDSAIPSVTKITGNERIRPAMGSRIDFDVSPVVEGLSIDLRGSTVSRPIDLIDQHSSWVS